MRVAARLGHPFASLALALALAACGFRPLYAPAPEIAASPVQVEMAAVTVGNIPDRPGQLLRLALQQRLGSDRPGVARRYNLAIAYGISGEAIGILANSAATRTRLIGMANWTLTAQDSRRTVLAQGVARSLDDINQLDQQPFSGDLGNEAAQRRLAMALADQITLQIAAFFAKRESA
jgi:LPS-assembly lipoprotein